MLSGSEITEKARNDAAGHDDAMAIILAGYSDKIQLLGVSSVFGNQSIHKTTENVR